MSSLYAFQSMVLFVVLLVMLGIKIFAFASALRYSSRAYEAAGKLTKVGWCVITGLGLAAQLVLAGTSPLNLIDLGFVIAALVYLADVRPALREVTAR